MGYVEDLRAVIGHRRINLVGSVVLIRNADKQILMQKRVYPRGRWGLPGGLMELGESAEDTARREVMEETGLSLGKLTLLGVYSGEGHLCRAENGDEFYTVICAYTCAEFDGTPIVNDHESLALAWHDPNNLPDDVARTHRAILEDYIGQW